MKKIHLIVSLTICNVLLVTGQKQCFQYTWPGPRNRTDKNLQPINCTEYAEKRAYVPCIEPIFELDRMPNTTQIWEIKEKNGKIDDEDASSFFCSMGGSNVCVKYTYLFNNAVVNVSYFCGKVVEDQTPVTSGCFVQHTDGYTIEACACESRNNVMPCNSTIKNTYSMLIIFIATVSLLFVYTICNIF